MGEKNKAMSPETAIKLLQIGEYYLDWRETLAPENTPSRFFRISGLLFLEPRPDKSLPKGLYTGLHFPEGKEIFITDTRTIEQKLHDAEITEDICSENSEAKRQGIFTGRGSVIVSNEQGQINYIMYQSMGFDLKAVQEIAGMSIDTAKKRLWQKNVSSQLRNPQYPDLQLNIPADLPAGRMTTH